MPIRSPARSDIGTFSLFLSPAITSLRCFAGWSWQALSYSAPFQQASGMRRDLGARGSANRRSDKKVQSLDARCTTMLRHHESMLGLPSGLIARRRSRPAVASRASAPSRQRPWQQASVKHARSSADRRSHEKNCHRHAAPRRPYGSGFGTGWKRERGTGGGEQLT